MGLKETVVNAREDFCLVYIPRLTPDNGTAMLLVSILVVRSVVSSLGQRWEVVFIPKVHLLETGEIRFEIKKLLEQVLLAKLPAKSLLTGMWKHFAANQGLG